MLRVLGKVDVVWVVLGLLLVKDSLEKVGVRLRVVQLVIRLLRVLLVCMLLRILVAFLVLRLLLAPDCASWCS